MERNAIKSALFTRIFGTWPSSGFMFCSFCITTNIHVYDMNLYQEAESTVKSEQLNFGLMLHQHNISYTATERRKHFSFSSYVHRQKHIRSGTKTIQLIELHDIPFTWGPFTRLSGHAYCQHLAKLKAAASRG